MSVHVAVCGAGAFGRNHLRVYRELAGQGVVLTAIVEPENARAAAILADMPADIPAPRIFPAVAVMLAACANGQLRLEAASVCTPTLLHHATTAALLRAGVHVLVEKPIAASLAEADDLIALAAKHDRVLQVGHLERFNPAVRALGPLLHGPMFFEAHRLSVFSPRSLDVDVVLDLMIHDLDVVLSLVASPVTDVQAVGLPILSRHTDIANVRVQFASGCVANFTASRVSTERVRKLRFFQPHQYLSVDYARQDLLVIEVTPTPEAAYPGLAMQKPEVTPGEPLRLEIEAFLEAVRTGMKPVVTGADARAALALALRIQEAIADHMRHTAFQG